MTREEWEARICEAYKSGLSMQAVAQKAGCSLAHISRTLKRLGVEARSRSGKVPNGYTWSEG